MATGNIVMSITVDTRKMQKQLRRTFSLRFKIAFFLIELAEKISRIKLDYTIEQKKGN